MAQMKIGVEGWYDSIAQPPDSDRDVLVVLEHGKLRIAFYYKEDETWELSGSRGTISNIVAWRELPISPTDAALEKMALRRQVDEAHESLKYAEHKYKTLNDLYSKRYLDEPR
jgi:hypothetical protein